MHELSLATEGDSDPARPLPFTKHRVLDRSKSCFSDLFGRKLNIGMTAGLPSRVQKYVNTDNRMPQPRSDNRRGNILVPNNQIWEGPILQVNPPREHCRYEERRSLFLAFEGQWQTETCGASGDWGVTWCSTRTVGGGGHMCSVGVEVHLEPIVVAAVKMQYLKPPGGASG